MAAAADKGALCQASCLLPAELLLRLLPMLPTPKGTLPTKACVNSTARSDSNSKPATAAVLLLVLDDDDENILRIFGRLGKRRPALACGLYNSKGGGGKCEDAVVGLHCGVAWWCCGWVGKQQQQKQENA